MTLPPEHQVPPPHERTMPHVPINEEGVRELELWIQRIVRRIARAASGWRFNILNGVPSAMTVDRGYGYVQFTGDGIDIDVDPEADPLAIGGTWGGAFIDDSGQGLLLGSNQGRVYIKGRGCPVTILADGQPGTSGLNLNVNQANLTVNLLTSGDTFVVKDHLGAAMFTLTG